MKVARLAALLPLLCLAAPLGGQTPQESYVATYADIAVREMYRSGIPASITLAQGLVESAAGQSTLAVKGNNHFGIKCHRGWTGKTIHADDDRKGECFRKYKNAEESFRDHSDFLRYADRYAFLFDYEITDYKSWAYGLKKAGYATDPSYPAKLLKVIADYGLDRYDTPGAAPADATAVPAARKLPPSPRTLEEPAVISGGREQLRFSLSRTLYSKNGVPYVHAVEGESFASLARQYDLFHKEILRFNDLREDRPLREGEVVFLQRKKNQAAKGLDKHIVAEGETLRDIAQRYGVRMRALVKLNALDASAPEIREGDMLKLRK